MKRQLDRFRITQELSKGALISVYKAFDLSLERYVTIKLLNLEHIAEDKLKFALEHFRQAAKNQAALLHPHIIPVHEIKDYEGDPYIVSAFLPGGRLDEKISTPVDIATALTWLLPVANALIYAHGKQIFHQNITPQSIYFDEKDRPMLTDFNLCLNNALNGECKPADATADIVALADVFCHTITGQHHSHPNLEKIQQQLSALGVANEIILRTTNLLQKAFSDNPGNQYPHMAAFHDALSAIITPVTSIEHQENLVDLSNLDVDDTTPDARQGFMQDLDNFIAELEETAQSTGKHVIELPNVIKPRTNINQVQIRLSANTDMTFVHIPAGQFLMGAITGPYDEIPQHEVILDDFLMARYPVTNQQFAVFVSETATKPPNHWQAHQPYENLLQHPVVNIDWQSATQFCDWLTTKAGFQIYLPTEAEWEKAARGTDGRIYPWGDDMPDERLSNFNNHAGMTTPVGAFSPQGDSPYGCADMAGNVWEWVSDWYDYEYHHRQMEWKNPKSSSSGSQKVIRGGSWHNLSRYLRTSYRQREREDWKAAFVGFRCAGKP